MIPQILRYLDHHYGELEKEMENLSISTLPFMSGPQTVLVIISSYLMFVLWIGPKYMEKRKPLDLKQYITLYNISQILLNGLLISAVMITIRKKIFTVLLSMSGERHETFQLDVNLMWLFFISRLWDLIDTVIIVLRKKNKQISFLHIYHHTSVCLIAWFFTKYLPVEQGQIFGFFNCVVHVLMYCYYLLASLGPKYKKYLWWKKYMTVFQMIQFIITMLYLISTLMVHGNVIKLASYILFVYAGVFFVLFYNFFNNTFTKKIE